MKGAQEGSRPHQAVRYRNWLTILLLTLLPLRLKNFTALRLGEQLRFSNDRWIVSISSSETKTRRKLIAPLPAEINGLLHYYVDVVRPTLLHGGLTEMLWTNWKGEPMSEHAMYLRITEFTRLELGDKINPHQFRHIAATSISILAPEIIDTARALLGHSTQTTTLQHYVTADSVIASRRHAELIRALRKNLPGAKRRSRNRKSFTGKTEENVRTEIPS
jgi:integrase